MATKVALELGSKRVFAVAIDWPGWARSGKSEEEALETLEAYARRYQPVAVRAGLDFSPGTLSVVERLPGSPTTDFGAPDAVAAADHRRLRATDGERLAALVAAAWAELDAVVARVPLELRRGPRGGGRDRDRLFDHVVRAEFSYARKIGVKHRLPADTSEADVPAMRASVLATLRAARSGEPPVERGWPTRYAAARIAWHTLDHAWEAEDRAE